MAAKRVAPKGRWTVEPRALLSAAKMVAKMVFRSVELMELLMAASRAEKMAFSKVGSWAVHSEETSAARRDALLVGR